MGRITDNHCSDNAVFLLSLIFYLNNVRSRAARLRKYVVKVARSEVEILSVLTNEVIDSDLKP